MWAGFVADASVIGGQYCQDCHGCRADRQPRRVAVACSPTRSIPTPRASCGRVRKSSSARPSRRNVRLVAESRTAVAVAIAVLVVASCGGSSKRVVRPAVAHSSLEFRTVHATFSRVQTCTRSRHCRLHGLFSVIVRRRRASTSAPTLLPGTNVAGAQAEVNPATNAWEVNVHFADDAFVTKVATPYVGKRIAIVLDGVVLSAPTIEPGITGRDITISADFDEATARVATEISP